MPDVARRLRRLEMAYAAAAAAESDEDTEGLASLLAWRRRQGWTDPEDGEPFVALPCPRQGLSTLLEPFDSQQAITRLCQEDVCADC